MLFKRRLPETSSRGFHRWQFVSVALLLAALCMSHSSAQADGLSADDIMKKVDTRYTGDTQKSQATLTLVDKKGRERVRHLTLLGMETPEVEKSIIYFLSPADVKGTAYMSFDWADETKEDDAWLYLPALEQVNRVAASDESGSFMGSDFSYADINGADFEDFNYTLLSESESVEGQDCWKILSTPKNGAIIEKTGYTPSENWIQKDRFVMVRGKITLKNGKRIKYFSTADWELIDDIWTAKRLQMITTRNGKQEHASVFEINNITYNEAVDETLFTTQAIQRGAQ